MTPGEFSQRGDILDVYPLDAENPIRVEFFLVMRLMRFALLM